MQDNRKDNLESCGLFLRKRKAISRLQSDWENNILYYDICASEIIFFQKRILSFSAGFPEP